MATHSIRPDSIQNLCIQAVETDVVTQSTVGKVQSPRSGFTPVGSPATSRVRRGANPAIVLVVIGCGALLSFGLWWRDTSSILGWGALLTEAGRLTGLAAGYGVVVLVALMARVPPLERGVGADRLARWHAAGGRYTVCLVVAHALLITWGYAVTAHTSLVAQAGTLLLSYPDVMMASVAGLLLVGVGVVSARAARRRMRYETWYLLHLYTYLAIALAFSHQFADGAQFATDRPARVVWGGMYLAVAAAIVWYRMAVPLRQAGRHRLRVVSVQQESPNVTSVVVTGRHLDELRAQPGEFFRWRFLQRGMWWANNPYSLSTAPQPDRLRFTAKDVGDHSALLTSLRPGTRVVTEGPYGALTAARRRHRKCLLVAGGLGITPLRALFETLPAAPGELSLVYRARDDADVLFRGELTEIARARGAQLYIVTGSRADHGLDPLSVASLTANVPDLREREIYICGPAQMTATVVGNLRSAGVKRRQIHHETFAF
jgi:predicted ferric reductase